MTVAVVVTAFAAAGCGGEAPRRHAGPIHGAEAVQDECVDADGDGAGPGCDASDCDDSDPEVTDACEALPGCTDGASRSCKVDLPEQNGVKSCFVGVQVCEQGEWQPCGAEG